MTPQNNLRPRTEDEEYLMSLIACTIGDVFQRTDDINGKKIAETAQKMGELTETVTSIAQSVAITNENVKAVLATVAQHDNILRGSSELGLVGKTERIIPMVEEMHLALWGTPDKLGIISRVNNLESANARWSKPVWIAITAAITFAITYGLDKFLH